MNTPMTATAIAHPNIAFIKYWGNRDEDLRIPVNGSISMNLAELETRTTVQFSPDFDSDQLILNGKLETGPGLARMAAFLDRVRGLAGITDYAQVASENNFPTGSGIASSAAAFAALALAASRAAGLTLSEPQLSALARSGSGSASRSVPGGFVEWYPGTDHQSSFAASIAAPDHWALSDCVAVVSRQHKATGSTGGHAIAGTSPLQAARVVDAPRRLEICRQALLEKDFNALAEVVELDSNMMHGVMMTSTPRLMYWQPATVAVMEAVTGWRRQGLPACYTIDAGANVHVLTPGGSAAQVAQKLQQVPGVLEVLQATPGGPVHLV